MRASLLPPTVRRSVMTVGLFVVVVALTAKVIDLVVAGAGFA
ncbi:MAG TPA: hypothetical protein VGI79_05815 [Caulobacteraceae bacterium]|jgi:hypothetical protein